MLAVREDDSPLLLMRVECVKTVGILIWRGMFE